MVYGAALVCGTSALPAAPSALLGTALTTRPLHWGHSWSHCTTREGHDQCHSGVMTGPAAPHIRDMTAPSTHGGVGLIPTAVTLLGRSEGVSWEGEPSKTGRPSTQNSRGSCNPGLVLLGPSICGTPNPCTAVGAPVCRGRGWQRRDSTGSLSCCSRGRATRSPVPTSGAGALSEPVTSASPGAGGREHLLGRPAVRGRGSRQDPRPAPPGPLLAATLMRGDRAAGRTDGTGQTDRQTGKRAPLPTPWPGHAAGHRCPTLTRS